MIALYSGKQSDDQAVAAVGQAVNRIEWALSEVLPAQLLSESLSANLPAQLDSRIIKH